MTYDGQVKRKSFWQTFRTSAILLCFLASCAVYDAAPPQGTADASNGGTSDIARGGSEVDAAGRAGTAPTAAAGTLGDVGPGGADTGGSGAAGSPDGGAVDAGAGGNVSGGSTNHAGAAGSANGGRGGTAGATGGSAGNGGVGGSAGNGGMGGSAGNGGMGGSAGNGGTGGNAATITDLTTKQPTTASSEQSGHAPASGNDGDGATRWCASSGAFPQWWRVDLGATHALKDYRISFEYPDRKYYFDVETSTDDAVYTRQIRTSGSAALLSGSFPGGVSARYVRLTITSADAGATPTWASFFEFVVTGT